MEETIVCAAVDRLKAKITCNSPLCNRKCKHEVIEVQKTANARIIPACAGRTDHLGEVAVSPSVSSRTPKGSPANPEVMKKVAPPCCQGAATLGRYQSCH